MVDLSQNDTDYVPRKTQDFSDEAVSFTAKDFDEVENDANLDSTERTAIRAYLKQIGKTPLLTLAEETALAKRVLAGDVKARNHMITANLRLVVKIARDYNHFGVPLLDLISEGNIGLIKAIERFDPSKGGKLSTYASWWIKQAIKRAIAAQGKSIRIPVHLMDRMALLRRVTTQLNNELQREPTDEEIAEQMELPTHKISHLKSIGTRSASLDAPIGNDTDSGATFGDLVRDENMKSPFEDLRGRTAVADIQTMIESLDFREQQIIRMRFGIDGERPMTLEEVGDKNKLTRERIRQLEYSAIAKLRNMINENERQRTAEEIRKDRLKRAREEVFHSFFLNAKK